MCMCHSRFSLVVLPKGLITFFIMTSHSKISAPTNLLWFNPHLCIWETLKARFIGMCEGSPNSSTSLFFFHLQRCGRSCLFKGYHLDNLFGEPKVCHPIIASIFLQDDHPFLLRSIGVSNSSPLPFQVDLRWVHDLLLLIIQIFHPPFEQL